MQDDAAVRDLQQRLPFWDKLSLDEQQGLAASTMSVKYRAGQNIHNASEQCVGVLLIKSGELRTYMMAENGREVTLYRLYGGDVCILSASCVLQSITFDVFIDAERDTEVLLISPAYFLKLLEQNVHVENFSLKITADVFSEVMWTMEQILFMSFDQRLAVFLMDEASKTGAGTLHMTHEQIARYTGSAREVVSRMLKYFEQEGIVKLSRGTVELADKERLRNLAVLQ
ncbi:MAG: Crp/Fnr family transcriptional regulator [Clostridiales bacterium]|nr:Crp/Fnr family transcriptional regulator [Clostridiales bacterium]